MNSAVGPSQALLPFILKRSRSVRARPSYLHVAGLFAGIGGIERGLARAGHMTSLMCEIEPAAKKVLIERFHGVEVRPDIVALKSLPRDVSLVAAGFPCQDLSQAGKTAGISGSSSGLIDEVFRLLQKQRIPNVLLENVPFMLQLGGGRALDYVLSRLETLSYNWAYRVVDSRSFGVPQRRERVYIVASQVLDPRGVLLIDEAGEPEAPKAEPMSVPCGFYWTEGIRGLGWAVDAVPTLKGGSTIGIPSPPAIVFPSGLVATPDIRDAERLQGFPADWTKPAERVARKGARWKLVGNAVTVGAAEWIGRRLARPGIYDANGDAALTPARPWPRAAWNLGHGRFAADLSAWPVNRRKPGLLKFLRYQVEPLSAKATAGFLERTSRSSLRFPPGFLDRLEKHLAAVRSEQNAAG